MAYIKVNTDTQDQIRDEMKCAVTAAEEAEATLRQTASEMAGDLAGYYDLPQWSSVVSLTDKALDDIVKVADRLRALETVIMNLSSDYSDVERVHSDALKEISANMDNMACSIAASMASDFPVGIEESEGDSNLRQLEQSLSNTVVSMEIANIAAVSKVVEDEYNYDNVKPVSYINVNNTNVDEDEIKKDNKASDTEEENQ